MKYRSQACNFIKKETLTQVFFYEFCEIIKNTFFEELLRATASGIWLFTFFAHPLFVYIFRSWCRFRNRWLFKKQKHRYFRNYLFATRKSPFCRDFTNFFNLSLTHRITFSSFIKIKIGTFDYSFNISGSIMPCRI